MSESVKVIVEWASGTKGVVTFEDPEGDLEPYTLDVGNLASAKVRNQMVSSAMSQIPHNAQDEAEVAILRAALTDKLLVQVRERKDYLKAHPEAKLAKAGSAVANGTDWQLTDAGNAYRLYDQHGHAIRYVPEMKKWFRYDGRQWCSDDLGQMMRLAMKTAGTIINEAAAIAPIDSARSKKMYNHGVASLNEDRLRKLLVCAQPLCAVRPQELDADNWKFNCANWTLDLRTGHPLPHNPTDLITRMSPVVYNPAATCPTFDQFMLTIMNGSSDMISYIQKVLGSCLTGDITGQFLFVFYGSGANGKSTLLDTIRFILGELAGLAPATLLAGSKQEHATEFADLKGKRLVVASETNAGDRLKDATVKMLTGEESIKARFMHCNFFEFVRTHKMILQTNHKPTLSDTGESMSRRLRLVPFAVTIPVGHRDPNLLEKLKAEASGILNWLLQGCGAWLCSGKRLDAPNEVMDATAAYLNDENPIKEFLDSRCIVSDRASVTRPQLIGTYTQWAQAAGVQKPLKSGDLYELILRIGGVTCAQWRSEGSTVPTRGFHGIGLIPFQPASN